MEEQTTQIFTKKNIISFLVIGILLLSIPFGVRLVIEQTQLRSRAAADPITFVPSETVACKTVNNRQECTTTSDTVSIELRSPLGPPGSVIPTLSSNLNINGAVVNNSRSYTVTKGTIVNFTANAKSTGKDLTRGWMEVIKTDKTAAPCGSGTGGTYRPDNLWCVLQNTALSGTSGTLTGTWTPNTAGEYYITTSLFVSSNVSYTEGQGCTSVPWCVFGTGNCKDNMWTYGSCGPSGYIKLIVN